MEEIQEWRTTWYLNLSSASLWDLVVTNQFSIHILDTVVYPKWSWKQFHYNTDSLQYFIRNLLWTRHKSLYWFWWLLFWVLGDRLQFHVDSFCMNHSHNPFPVYFFEVEQELKGALEATSIVNSEIVLEFYFIFGWVGFF